MSFGGDTRVHRRGHHPAPMVNITPIIRRQHRKSLRHNHLPRLHHADDGGDSCIDLEATGSRIRCPLLVVHGGRDTITPMDNATLMMAAAAGPLETLIWEDSGHCCHDRSHIVRPAMADFMVRRLQ